MHKALGNPNFVFTNIDKEHPLTPRLFMATDSSKPNDRNYEKLSSGLEISSYTTPSQYFFESLLNPVRVRLRQLQTEAARQRVIVYLNSRANMEYINKHYFLNRLQFLPIQVDKLRWNFLDDLVWNRNYLWLLPPQTKGLALLVCSHKQGTGRLSGIEAMTTVLTNGDQIISLWSPMLVDGSRTTMMLYGIGQLDMLLASKVREHLDNIQKMWEGKGVKTTFWDAAYFLETLPSDFIFNTYYHKDYHDPKSQIRQEAEREIEKVADLIRSE